MLQRWLHMRRAWGILLGALMTTVVAGPLHAATFDVQPRTLKVGDGDTLTFTVTLEGDPGHSEFVPGSEIAQLIRITGACSYSHRFYGYPEQYGLDYTLSLDSFDNFPVCGGVNMRAGSYRAFFQYGKVDAEGRLTHSQPEIEVSFEVFGDSDLDGVFDNEDNCPVKPNPGQEDADDDDVGDACDPDNTDRDQDGVPNEFDNCPDTPNSDQLNSDNDALGDECDPSDFDTDNDGVDDDVDNCPNDFNPGQEDVNPENGTGDACDNDPDLDGVPTFQNGLYLDNCPLIYNPGQEDSDHNRFGDACDDPDEDDDGVTDDVDNCLTVPNPGQTESEVPPDGQGDACDPPDSDGDGVTNSIDNCPTLFNPGQVDTDDDFVGDACDDDYDPDHDGIGGSNDNCTFHANPDQWDANNNGIGDACDRFSDTDGDGLSDMQEHQLGTDSNASTTIAPGTNTYTSGEPVTSENPGMVGLPIGVAISAPDGVDEVAVTVSDPNGETAFQDTLVPQSPVVFSFTPDLPGDWTISAELRADGALVDTLTVPLQVLPSTSVGCSGDCNGDGAVMINELVTGVRIALSQLEVDQCVVMDSNGDGRVAVNEVVEAVRNGLAGCPA